MFKDAASLDKSLTLQGFCPKHWMIYLCGPFNLNVHSFIDFFSDCSLIVSHTPSGCSEAQLYLYCLLVPLTLWYLSTMMYYLGKTEIIFWEEEQKEGFISVFCALPGFSQSSSFDFHMSPRRAFPKTLERKFGFLVSPGLAPSLCLFLKRLT